MSTHKKYENQTPNIANTKYEKKKEIMLNIGNISPYKFEIGEYRICKVDFYSRGR